MNLQKLFAAIDYRITESSPYLWNCYGKSARIIDSDIDFDHTVSFIFDSVSKEIYEVTVAEFDNESITTRWTNPCYIEARNKEEIDRIETPYTTFIDVSEDEIMEKIHVLIPPLEMEEIEIKIEDELLFSLMKEAHNQDITFNQFVINILLDQIARDSND